MDRTRLRKKAIKLRKQGKTYTEIQRELKMRIPKSTLSGWCKDVELPKEYQKRIKKIILKNAQKGRTVALIVNRVKREKLLNALRAKNEHFVRYLNKNVCKLLLSILYLGEGSKHKSARELRLGNADSEIIKFYLKLLYKCFPVSKKKFRVCIGCRVDQNVKELEEYWHSVTKIPFSQFHKTQIDRRTIGKKTKKKDYKGVCTITYYDTRIQLELEELAQQIMKWI